MTSTYLNLQSNVNATYRISGAVIRLDTNEMGLLGSFLEEALEHAERNDVEFHGADFADALARHLNKLINADWGARYAERNIHDAELAMNRGDRLIKEAARSAPARDFGDHRDG